MILSYTWLRKNESFVCSHNSFQVFCSFSYFVIWRGMFHFKTSKHYKKYPSSSFSPDFYDLVEDLFMSDFYCSAAAGGAQEDATTQRVFIYIKTHDNIHTSAKRCKVKVNCSPAWLRLSCWFSFFFPFLPFLLCQQNEWREKVTLSRTFPFLQKEPQKKSLCYTDSDDSDGDDDYRETFIALCICFFTANKQTMRFDR